MAAPHAAEYYEAAELDRISEIGIYEDRFYYNEGGKIVSLALKDGSVMWENDEFGGGLVNSIIDDSTVAATFECGPEGHRDEGYVFYVNLSDYSFSLMESNPAASSPAPTQTAYPDWSEAAKVIREDFDGDGRQEILYLIFTKMDEQDPIGSSCEIYYSDENHTAPVLLSEPMEYVVDAFRDMFVFQKDSVWYAAANFSRRVAADFVATEIYRLDGKIDGSNERLRRLIFEGGTITAEPVEYNSGATELSPVLDGTIEEIGAFLGIEPVYMNGIMCDGITVDGLEILGPSIGDDPSVKCHIRNTNPHYSIYGVVPSMPMAEGKERMLAAGLELLNETESENGIYMEFTDGERVISLDSHYKKEEGEKENVGSIVVNR